jgi:hypothetical protein
MSEVETLAKALQSALRPTTVIVQPDRYVTIALAATLTGLSVRAIERKIASGTWAEGMEYRRCPDGTLRVDMEGYRRWVERS